MFVVFFLTGLLLCSFLLLSNKQEGEKRGRGRPRGSDSSILSSSNDSSNDSIAVSNANHHENGSHSGKTSAKDIKNTSNNGKKINGMMSVLFMAQQQGLLGRNIVKV